MFEESACHTTRTARWLQPRVLTARFPALLWLASVSVAAVAAAPPYKGTVFLDPNILTESDPTALQSLTPEGRGDRVMFDRRVNGWITAHAFLFHARFDDGLTIEIQVNPELATASLALAEASKYAESIGRIPTVLRTGVETVWLHRGRKLFGGGNKNILIHLQMAEEYMRDGFLEEALMHEGAHSSLDPQHKRSSGWRAAQTADGGYISEYARDHPDREDLAESFVPYYAVRHRVGRIPNAMRETILKTIPNRIAYFDSMTRKILAIGAPLPRLPFNPSGASAAGNPHWPCMSWRSNRELSPKLVPTWLDCEMRLRSSRMATALQVSSEWRPASGRSSAVRANGPTGVGGRH